jgi:transaldolase / glucose-6-phosphate isomerase
MGDRLNQLAALGQSIWLDYIRRSFTLEGGLARLVNEGLRGVTSNPAIFEKAIAGSDDYDAQLLALAKADVSSVAIYEALALEDVQNAADTLRRVYEATEGRDGYVSLEVSPDLAYDTGETIAEARRLFAAADRPNVLIKVPATPEGIPAITTLIGEGINVNVTLIFSVAQYDAVVDAYLAGLEALVESGGDLTKVASVASLFLSRVDVKVDAALNEIGSPEAKALRGKIALANAKVAYQHFRKLFSGPRWEQLAAKGAYYQRPLWASTSTKNPDYPDTMYIDHLIGPHTVNTTPPETLDAFLAGDQPLTTTVEVGLAEAEDTLARLKALGIDLDEVMQALLDEGVEKFVRPFTSLMSSIEEKVRDLSLAAEIGRRYRARLGDYGESVSDVRDRLEAEDVLSRIQDHDFSVWDVDPTEIANRLGWLEAPDIFRRHLDRVNALVDSARADGYTHVLLLGMGGSSLAPDVFSQVFGASDGYLALDILDSTDPGAVLAYDRQLDLAKTLFIVASKSGGTAETLSFYRYFYNRVADTVGGAGAHFVAITDPQSKLLDEADARDFRAVFINDPTVGGRYSALTYFGVIPAALMGIDVATLLDRASSARADAAAVAVELGATMGALAKAGRDKLTLVVPPALANFGDWVEQLVAESTGKQGTGILPVVDEPLTSPGVYGDDRLFVVLHIAGEASDADRIAALVDAGHPVVEMTLRDRYDLGAQLYIWELATAIAGYLLGIQPFNQPNVEAAKKLARKMIAAYQASGELPEIETTPFTAAALRAFLDQAKAGDYVALQAYVQPTAATTAALQALRLALRERTNLATTVGYGPRYLHSTGQLHKGDGGQGLFIQFTADAPEDVDIPDEDGAGDENSSGSSISFGVLVRAQALGDYEALASADRRVIHFHLDETVDIAEALRQMAADL